MADIELVVKISEDDYEKMKWTGVKNGAKEELDYMRGLILSGTPLPKHHGRLIILSEDAVKREQIPLSFTSQEWISEVGLSNATVAIIEESEE